jgi:hypothetical protein
MKPIIVEKFLEQKLNADVYPITLVKFLLNKRKILGYFSKAAEKDFEIRGPKLKADPTGCEDCEKKKSEGVLCRQHTSINRVLTAEKVAIDLDSNCYFYKNEIFRMVGDKLVIIYCPHPKLITGPIEDEKVRRINPITIQDPSIQLPEYKHVATFMSSHLMDQNMKCWFNAEFSIVTIPEDRNFSNFCLVCNK